MSVRSVDRLRATGALEWVNVCPHGARPTVGITVDAVNAFLYENAVRGSFARQSVRPAVLAGPEEPMPADENHTTPAPPGAPPLVKPAADPVGEAERAPASPGAAEALPEGITVRIGKNGVPSYRVRVQVRGERFERSFADDLSSALMFREAALAGRLSSSTDDAWREEPEGEVALPSPTPGSAPPLPAWAAPRADRRVPGGLTPHSTLEQLAEVFLNLAAGKKIISRRGRPYAPQTVVGYRDMLQGPGWNQIRRRRIVDLDAADYQDACALTAGSRGYRTAEKFRAFMFTLTRFALQHKLIETREAILTIVVPHVNVKTRPRRPVAFEEIPPLLAAARASDRERRERTALPAVVLGAEAGLRPQEIVLIRRGDVNLDTGEVMVERALKKGLEEGIWIESETKTDDSVQTAVLTPTGIAALRESFPDWDRLPAHRHLVHRPRQRFVTTHQLHDLLEQVSARAGITPPILPSDLRGHFLSLIEAVGESDAVLARMARHADSSQVARKHYVRAAEERALAAPARADAHREQLLAGDDKEPGDA